MLNKKGYSIIELIVSLGIIGLIFGLSLSFYKNNNTKNFINNDAYLLKTNILKTRNMAISGQSNIKFSENNNYGIYLSVNNSKYYLYKDLNLNNHYDSNEIIENIKLNNSLVNSLSFGSNMDILFKSDNSIFLNSSITKSENINISLMYKNITKIININALTSVVSVK